MILEFSIANYRSFKNKQTISFDPTSDTTLDEYFCSEIETGIKILKFGAIYGPNASGKTNLLLGLEFLRKIAIKPRKSEELTGFIPFLFDKDTAKNPGEFNIIFYYNKIKYNYYIKLDKSRVHEENLIYYPKLQPVEVFSRSFDNFKFGAHPDVNISKKYRDALETNTVKSMTLLSALQVTNVEFPVLKNAFRWFNESFMPIILPTTPLTRWTIDRIEDSIECRELLIDLMRKADFNINDIEILKEDIPIDNKFKKILSDTEIIPEQVKEDIIKKGMVNKIELSLFHNIINKNHKEIFSLPFDHESSGTKRFFGLGGPLNMLIKNKKLLLIDELEGSLHPDLINYFINFFLANSDSSQLLVTTHNLDIMSDPDEIRRDVIWFTEKKEDGSTELYSLSDFKSSDIRKGMNYLKAYKSGKFGALPRLDNLFLKK